MIYESYNETAYDEVRKDVNLLPNLSFDIGSNNGPIFISGMYDTKINSKLGHIYTAIIIILIFYQCFVLG